MNDNDLSFLKMKVYNIFMLMFLCLCSGFVCAKPQSIAEDQWAYWDKSIGADDLSVLLFNIKKNIKYKWPAVHSESFSIKLSLDQQKFQKEFRLLSIALMQQIEDYVEFSEREKSDVFYDKLNSMIKLRDLVSKYPSYINWVLADSINRFIYLNLRQRVAFHDMEIEASRKTLAKLDNYKLDISAIQMIVELELDQVLDKEIEHGVDSFRKGLQAEMGMSQDMVNLYIENIGKDVTVFRAIWDYLAPPGSSMMIPNNLLEATTLSLLAKRELSLLLWRMVYTDYYIRTALPLLVKYKEKEKKFSINDDYQKIRLTLGKDMGKYKSLGAKLIGQRNASGTVLNMLQLIKRGGTEQEFYLR
ncbi:MAG: hypothetical protein GXP17_04660 [Gammaproteobacteria bacterium]|nr:hypothetical protein [Gammaproteobacteria bacterium]